MLKKYIYTSPGEHRWEHVYVLPSILNYYYLSLPPIVSDYWLFFLFNRSHWKQKQISPTILWYICNSLSSNGFGEETRWIGDCWLNDSQTDTDTCMHSNLDSDLDSIPYVHIRLIYLCIHQKNFNFDNENISNKIFNFKNHHKKLKTQINIKTTNLVIIF